MRLGDDARLLRHVRGQRMVEIVGVGQRVGEHERGPHLAIHIHQPEQRLVAGAHGVVAHVEELEVRHAQHLGRALGFLAPRRLHLLQRDALLPPQLLRLPALPV